MIIGNPRVFAIESEIVEYASDGWVFGHFRFWIMGQTIGDWSDYTDLKGCANWLREFIEVDVNRSESVLENKPGEEVFRLLYESVMVGNNDTSEPDSIFKDVFARFHISHIGMSSFDQYGIILIEDKHKQRLIWRYDGDLEIKEALLPSNEMQNVSAKYLQWFYNEIGPN